MIYWFTLVENLYLVAKDVIETLLVALVLVFIGFVHLVNLTVLVR